jgi:hypothetical protein
MEVLFERQRESELRLMEKPMRQFEENLGKTRQLFELEFVST